MQDEAGKSPKPLKCPLRKKGGLRSKGVPRATGSFVALGVKSPCSKKDTRQEHEIGDENRATASSWYATKTEKKKIEERDWVRKV